MPLASSAGAVPKPKKIISMVDSTALARLALHASVLYTSAQGSLRIGAQRVELLRQYGVL